MILKLFFKIITRRNSDLKWVFSCHELGMVASAFDPSTGEVRQVDAWSSLASQSSLVDGPQVPVYHDKTKCPY